MRNKTLTTVGIVLLAILALCFSTEIYYLRESTGGDLWWHQDEAYLFLGSGADGHHLRVAAYPWETLKEHLYAPAFPDDRRFAVTVIRITDSAIERHNVDFGREAGNGADFLTPFGEDFYAMCTGMILCKWVGSHFDPATVEEQHKFGGVDHLLRGEIGDNSVNGWFRRSTDPAPGDHLSINVGGKFSILVENKATNKLSYPDISIELIRPGQAPVNLWHVDGTPRIVSEKEYEAAFQPSPR